MSEMYAVTVWERHAADCIHCQGECLAIYQTRFVRGRPAADYAFDYLSLTPGAVMTELLELIGGHRWSAVKQKTQSSRETRKVWLPCVPAVGQQHALFVQEYDAATVANPLLQPVGLPDLPGDQ